MSLFRTMGASWVQQIGSFRKAPQSHVCRIIATVRLNTCGMICIVAREAKITDVRGCAAGRGDGLRHSGHVKIMFWRSFEGQAEGVSEALSACG